MMEAVRSAYRRRAGVKFFGNMHYFQSFSCIGRVHDTFLLCEFECLVILFWRRMLLADLERSSNGLIMETVRQWEVVHGLLQEGVVA